MAFQLHQPSNVADAVRTAAAYGGDARFLAGGTDLLIQINRRRCAPAHLIPLGGIDGLAGIECGDASIRIGAMTTHKALERGFAGRIDALAEAARVVGGHQIRNIATLGGNVVNASPAADLLPPLLVLETDVALAGPQGTRRVTLHDFLRGPGVTDRHNDELLTGVAFPVPAGGAATAFLKAGRRRAMEISIVCVSAFLRITEGRCREARIALGAVGPTAMRVAEAESALQNAEPSDAAFREAGRIAAAACQPISDVRASAEYRRALVQTLVPRALQRCVQRIGVA